MSGLSGPFGTIHDLRGLEDFFQVGDPALQASLVELRFVISRIFAKVSMTFRLFDGLSDLRSDRPFELLKLLLQLLEARPRQQCFLSHNKSFIVTQGPKTREPMPRLGVNWGFMKFQAPRGTNDVLPSEAMQWRQIERAFEHVMGGMGYGEIRTPMFEEIELFRRSSGETSEVVSKQMYDFHDKGDRHLALKPEGTAPAIRAYLEHSLAQPGQITRLWYFTPIFRYERPQKGRYRQAHQAGIELIGSSSPAADVEVIEAAVRFYEAIGLKDLTVLLNSIGRAEARIKYCQLILDKLSSWLPGQPLESQQRAEKNPLRLLDSKDPSIQAELVGLPSIFESLEPESLAHYRKVERLLERAGISYVQDPTIVRGLDYYNDTVFEIQSSALGAQSSLCGGGRYDGLIQQLGGPTTPAVGFGAGLERARIAREAAGFPLEELSVDVFVAGEPLTESETEAWVRLLRQSGLSATYDFDLRDLKRQLKMADRARATFVILVGPEEISTGVFKIKTMAESRQDEIPREQVVSWLQSRRPRAET